MSRFKGVTVPAFTVLVLLIVFGVPYFFYVSSQMSYFNNRNFRLLGSLSLQLNSQIESYREILTKAAKKDPDTEGRTEPSPEQPREFIENAIKAAVALVPTLQLDPRPNLQDPLVVERVASPAGKPDPAPEITLDVKEEKGKTWLNLLYDGPTGVKGYKATISVRTSFQGLLEPLVSRDLFDDILVVAQHDGRVIFQRNPSGYRVAQLDPVFKLLGRGGKNAGSDEIPVTVRSISTLEVNLADTDFKVFLQPVRLPFGVAIAAQNQPVFQFVICGLVRSDRFRSDSLAISYTLVLVFVFLILLAFLGWPFVKLWSMGPTDRLRVSDVCFLAASTLISAVLVALFLLDLYAYHALEENMDDQLETFAGKIASQFNAELEKAYNQLDTFNKTIDLRQNARDTGVLKKKPVEAYPYFDMAFWINSKGDQQGKWTVKKALTPMINVKERDYFKNAKEDRLWSMNSSRFYLESIISLTTGETSAVLSVPFTTAGAPGNTEIAVAAIETKLLSVIRPVVPAGFGYAVIAPGGKVLFHSDNTRNLRENFLQETDDDLGLQAALYGGNSDWIDAHYWGTGHRLYVIPLKGVPWSLVVYREKQILRTTNLELLSTSIILFLLYSLMTLIFQWLGYLGLSVFRSPKGGANWLWPDPGCTGLYYRITVVNILLSALFCLLLFGPTSWGMRILALLIPSAGLLYAFFALGGKPAEETADRRPDSFRRDPAVFRRGYLFSGFSLLVLVGILPAVAFFKLSHGSEMELLIKQGQLKLASALERRVERVRQGYRDIPVQDDKKWLSDRLRLNGASDLYYTHFFSTTIHETPHVPTIDSRSRDDGFKQLLTLIRLPYNQISIESQGLIPDAATDGSWDWRPVSPSKLEFRKRKYRESEDLLITSQIPELTTPNHLHAWLGLCVALFLLFLLPWILIRAISRRVFLLDLEEPAASGREVLSSGRIAENILAVGLPFSGKSELLKRDDVGLVDLRSTAREERWAETFSYADLLKRADQVIAIDHFEFKINDAASNREKLRFLEELLDRKRTLIVMSAVDPLADPPPLGNGNAQAGRGDPHESEDWDRWASVFSAFSRVFIDDPGEAATFMAMMSQLEERMASDHTTGPATKANISRKRLSHLVRLVKVECRPTGYLQSVGKEIASLRGFIGFTPQQMVEYILDRSRGYYRLLWSSCSRSEKSALAHLAQDGFISSANRDIGPLLRKRLIVRDPSLRCMNESFRRFLMSECRLRDVGREEVGSTWQALRAPLLTVFLGLALFLFMTQRSLVSTSLAFVSVLTTALPALFKLLDLFQSGSGKKPGG